MSTTPDPDMERAVRAIRAHLQHVREALAETMRTDSGLTATEAVAIDDMAERAIAETKSLLPPPEVVLPDLPVTGSRPTTVRLCLPDGSDVADPGEDTPILRYRVTATSWAALTLADIAERCSAADRAALMELTGAHSLVVGP